MKLHKNRELFSDAVRFTAQEMNLPPIYVEKDYWVTFALYEIFHNEVGMDTIFKGGTALSKCYKMIERFSEDIDLVVLRHDGETDNRLKSKLKAIGKLIENELPEIDVEGICVGNWKKKFGKWKKYLKIVKKMVSLQLE